MEGGSDLDPNLVPGQEQRPWVEVRHPDGRTWVVEIAADVFRVGREAGWSDLDLDTDDRRWISRRHFRMERQGRGWTVVEEGSRNGTFLRRAGTLRRVEGTVPLRTGDAVAVLAGMDGVSPLYWELVFHDPDLTAPAPEGGSGAAAAYDWVEGRMFIVDGPVRTEVVGLRPQEHRLVRHLVSRNDEAGGAVLCPYPELIRAVWGDEAGHPTPGTTWPAWCTTFVASSTAWPPVPTCCRPCGASATAWPPCRHPPGREPAGERSCPPGERGRGARPVWVAGAGDVGSHPRRGTVRAAGGGWARPTMTGRRDRGRRRPPAVAPCRW